MIFRTCSLTAFACLAGLTFQPEVARGEDWPQWRGPRLDGTSKDTGFPLTAEGQVAWRVELPGSGHASPIVWGERVFVVAGLPENEERVLLCLARATGKRLWQSTVLKAPAEGTHKLNSLASSTPATDGERVFTAFLDNTESDATRAANAGRTIGKGEVPKGTVVVSTHDFSGKQVWQVRPGLFSSKHGFCSSPVVFEDKVIVNCDHDGAGYIVALARTDGRELWRIERPNQTRSYCVPLIREMAGRMQMVLSGTMCVASYDPRTGKQLWIMDGPTEQFVASLVYSEATGLLYMTGGFPEHHLLAIRPDGSGNVTETHIVWRTNKGVSYVPSPIVAGEFLLNVSDSGVAHCFEAKSGTILWEERMREHHASLTSAEGHVFFLNDFGVLRTVLPERTYKLLAESELKERVFASPALSEGQMFVRTDRSLICLGKRGAKTAGR
jgi:outer membrane protein assembly factor BamB